MKTAKKIIRTVKPVSGKKHLKLTTAKRDRQPAVPLAQRNAFGDGYNAAWFNSVLREGETRRENPFKKADQRKQFAAGYKAAEGDGA